MGRPVSADDLPDRAVPEGDLPDGMRQIRLPANGKIPQQKDRFAPQFNPTQDMSGPERFRAGMGKSFADVGYGAKQAGVELAAPVANAFDPEGRPARSARIAELRAGQDERRRLDAPLMDTRGGMAGNVAGNLAVMAPVALIPGVNTITGGTLVGAGAGAIQPVGTKDSRTQNMVVGGATGAAIPAAIRTGKIVKSLAQPFYEKGQQQIVGNVLRNAAGENVDDVVRNLQQAQPLVPGSVPSAGQASKNAGIAALERTAEAIDAPAYDQARRAQSTARLLALEGLKGSDDAYSAALKARAQATNPLYAEVAKSTAVADPTRTVNLVDRIIETNPKREALVNALQGVRGTLFDAAPDGSLVPTQSPQALKSASQNIGDLINAKGPTGNRLNEAIVRELALVKKSLDAQIGKAEPAYAAAQKGFQEASRPINQMDVARMIADKSVNPVRETIRPEAFARALSDKTAAQATGFKRARLENIMDPEQMGTLNAIKEDLARGVFRDTAGRPVGSDTVQKLAYANMLDKSGVPTLLRGMSAGQLVGNVVARGADALYGRANKEIAQRLAETLLNPQSAAEAMLMSQPKNPAVAAALQRALQTLPMATIPITAGN